MGGQNPLLGAVINVHIGIGGNVESAWAQYH